MNGFYAGTLMFQPAATGFSGQRFSVMNEKFRFRRKCDENDVVRVIARPRLIAGTFRTMILAGELQVVIRMR